MKKKLIKLSGMALLMLMTACGDETGTESGTTDAGNAKTDATDKGSITMSGAYALYPLAARWGEIYKQDKPDLHLDIQGGGAGKV
jgi:phosphate transport system substrate-binding protein